MHDAYIVFAILATLAAVAVNAGLVLAVIRYRARRGAEPELRLPGGVTPGRVAWALGALTTAAFTVGVLFNESARDAPASLAGAKQQPLRIRAAGQQWLWRYTYPDGTFSYYELVVPAGRTVRLSVDSTDVVHRWWVPELAGQTEAVPGRINRVYFRVDEPGIYDGQSTAFSGSAFAAMRTRVRAITESEYLAWLDNQRNDLLEAQSAVAKALRESSSPSGAPSAPLTPGVAPQTAPGGVQ
jgi:cytochrome c oxidase subunit 2